MTKKEKQIWKALLIEARRDLDGRVPLGLLVGPYMIPEDANRSVPFNDLSEDEILHSCFEIALERSGSLSDSWSPDDMWKVAEMVF